MNEWEPKIQELLYGTVDELIVPKDDFLTVRSLLVDKGWLFEVVGEAKHGGVTIYRKNEQSASS
ncbi:MULTISPECIES: hypothetical protein [Exiguobacterium]|jgi:hypothetical protein|uniref:hypothetical protein n=1 Tax=Exiguobacterium TaxID=33986 RepID=UPI0004967788|nr:MULTISPECIES: hypothetical protein [Exiguobacterium]TCI73756.1 hypothetical protein EVJ19_01060 [Exiguobacterium sp. IPCI3]TCI82914.1 hypothetical protein EVJ18_01060 [Exiguobacterium sp. IPCH1]TCI83969.1 hypothetical protein EVJ17_01060 [Exiguobacterium sp. IPBC4]